MSSTSSIVPDNFTSMKNNMGCDFCSLDDCFIGIHDLAIPATSGTNYEPKFKKNDRKNDNLHILCRVQEGSKVQFKMGNGKYTEDIEEAKDHLMKRTYPEIENGTQNVPVFIPEASLPEKYYRGVDPEKFQEKVNQLHTLEDKNEFTKFKNAEEEKSVFKGEHTEKLFFDEIHKRFQTQRMSFLPVFLRRLLTKTKSLTDMIGSYIIYGWKMAYAILVTYLLSYPISGAGDAFPSKKSKSVEITVLNGSHLPRYNDPKQDQESDFIVIDSKRKFILSLEIKSNLFSEAKGNVKKSSVQKGVEQISKIKKILEKYFCTNIDLTGWKFVGALGFGSKAEHVKCCPSCKPFIVDVTGVKALFNKLDRELTGTTSANLEAYKKLIRNLIFCIFANPGPVIKHNYDEETFRKIKQQGDWCNVLFWTPKQYEIMQLNEHNSPKYKHVIFESSYSTGKTEVMKGMIRKLIDKSQKIHFIFSYSSMDKGRHQIYDEILDPSQIK